MHARTFTPNELLLIVDYFETRRTADKVLIYQRTREASDGTFRVARIILDFTRGVRVSRATSRCKTAPTTPDTHFDIRQLPADTHVSLATMLKITM